MLKSMKTMIRLELCNLYGLNVLRHTKDKKEKRKKTAFAILCVFLTAYLLFYLCALSYGFVQIGLETVLPTYLIFLSSLIIFMFSIFKAGAVLFNAHGYTMLCSLPIPRAAVILSRFLRMYVEELAIALLTLLPGLAVYGYCLKPRISFYLCGMISAFLIPVIPLAASAFIGALITGVSSRMKHKSLVAAGLSILFVLVILFFSSRFSTLENISIDQLKEFSGTVLSFFDKIYPPAVWLGQAVAHGSFSQLFFCAALSFLFFGGVAALVCVCYHSICRNLHASFAKHNYHMQSLKSSSLCAALCKREFRHYFSSSVYLTNTIMGPILGTILAGILYFTDLDSLQSTFAAQLPFSVDFPSLIPILEAGILSMMPTTCAALSLEGKHWWISQSLPLPEKLILDAKLLMYLLLALPFYVLTEIFLIGALKPDTATLLWTLFLPAAFLAFSAVYGLAVNLHFPVLNWENEVSVVKQSVSSVLGGLGSLILTVLCVLGSALTPSRYLHLFQLSLCLLISVCTAVLYRRITGKNKLFKALE